MARPRSASRWTDRRWAIRSLVLGDDEVAAVRARLERYPWYARLFEGYRTRVDELLERRPPIPPSKGRAFYESCPHDDATLVFDPYAPDRHLCPKCGRLHSGETFDSGWVRQFQEWLAKRLVEAGIVYRLSGDDRYSAYVREVLLHFCAHYTDYPLANNLLGPTRLFQSTYLESFWLADMLRAYDLVRGAACFEARDHQAVRKLFYESSGVIRSYDERHSNRQAFNNVALGGVGLLYDDAELTEYALAGPHGFSFHMRASLLEDGLWYEGENYHFATLDHLLDLAEMARHRGIDLYRGESGYGALAPMFYGPLGAMFPDLSFPARKDGWFGRGIAYYREIYELAYARLEDARLGGLLAHAYAVGGGRDDLGWRAFLYLAPDLPEGDLEDLRPKNCEKMSGTGVAVLRADEGRTYASLEYGHYGGGHGHPDRLHLNLYTEGRQWLADPGTGWYHVPELAWYRSTLAHNTVTVDGLSQRPREGALHAFGRAGPFRTAQARVEEVYPGVDMRRTLCLGPGYLLDVCDLESDEEHDYDWTLHTRAGLRLNGPEATPTELPAQEGYAFLSSVAWRPAAELDAVLESEGASLRLLQLGSADLITARPPGIPLQDDEPVTALIARRRARRTRFATCYFYGEGAAEMPLVEEGAGRYALHLSGKPGGGEVHRILLDGEEGLALAVERQDKLQGLAWFGRLAFELAGVRVRGDKTLPQAALWFEGTNGSDVPGWRAELPKAFGRLEVESAAIEGPGGATRVSGLPVGAEQSASGRLLRLSQPPATAVWPAGRSAAFRLFAGCRNQVRFHTGSYGPDGAAEPELDLPPGWRLEDLREIPDSEPRSYLATLELPTYPRRSSGQLTVLLAGERHTLPFEVAAPLETSWKLVSERGRPYILLQARELRGAGGCVQGELVAPWLLTAPQPFSLELEPLGTATLRMSLPPAPVPPAPLEPQPPHGLWELPGDGGSAGSYHLWARLRLDRFEGLTRARLPLAWAGTDTASGSELLLDRPEQVCWAETPWPGPGDASARATVTWSAGGLRLRCEVTDDIHVADASEDDLYENDSLQVYFDFRARHHELADFTPGVAAYVLAPSADRTSVRIRAIAGNREISNRDARAAWFHADGIEGSCRPSQNGYLVDAFFPYAALGVPPAVPGDVLGFDLSLSDNDGTWYRKQQLVWSGARGRRCYIRGSYLDPRDYGYLIMAGEPPGGHSS